MKKFAIKENKCLEETYSKEDVDQKISNIKFQKVSGSLSVDGIRSYSLIEINYPEGFNVENTRILCVNYWRTDREGFGTGDLSYQTVCTAECYKNYIRAYIGRTGTGELSYGTYQIEVYLIKVE